MGKPFWTPKRDAVLRELWGTIPTADLARRLGVSESAVKSRARKRLGLPPRRERWTPAMDARLRELYPAATAAAVARAVGRSEKAVHQRAKLLRLVKHPHWPAAVVDRVRALNARGLCDRAVAERMPDVFAAGDAGRDAVKHIRQRHGLPFHPDADAKRRAVENQRKTLGIRRGGDLRALGHARYARANGWPADLPVRAVQVLNVLCERGPMTARGLAEAVGASLTRKNSVGGQAVYLACSATSRLCRGHGTYTGLLKARGLIFATRRSFGPGGGQGRHVTTYTITAKAIALREEILHERERERGAGAPQEQVDHPGRGRAADAAAVRGG